MKKIQVAVLAAGVLVLAGCGNKAADNQTTKETINEAVSEMTQGQANPGGVISSIKDAMGLGTMMKCTYKTKDIDGEFSTTSYVKGKKFMSETTVAGKTERMLFDGDAIYNWVDGKKEGTKMSMTCLDDINKETEKSSDKKEAIPITDPTDEDAFDDALDTKCEPASGMDISLPSGIKFADQCEAMKGFIKGLSDNEFMPKDLPGDLPGNIPFGSSENSL